MSNPITIFYPSPPVCRSLPLNSSTPTHHPPHLRFRCPPGNMRSSLSLKWLLFLAGFALLAATPVLASSGDRNPTFQHCLKGCGITYCDPSLPDTNPWYLRAGGWDCAANCKYSCMHSFTDNIKSGSRWHQCEQYLYPIAPVEDFQADM